MHDVSEITSDNRHTVSTGDVLLIGTGFIYVRETSETTFPSADLIVHGYYWREEQKCWDERISAVRLHGNMPCAVHKVIHAELCFPFMPAVAEGK